MCAIDRGTVANSTTADGGGAVSRPPISLAERVQLLFATSQPHGLPATPHSVATHTGLDEGLIAGIRSGVVQAVDEADLGAIAAHFLVDSAYLTGNDRDAEVRAYHEDLLNYREVINDGASLVALRAHGRDLSAEASAALRDLIAQTNDRYGPR